MDDSLQVALRVLQGPVFRVALALMLLGFARLAALGISDAVAAYIAERDRPALGRKFRLRLLWHAFPTLLLYRAGVVRSAGSFLYHAFFSCVSLVFRLCAVLVPLFMVAHVHFWERALPWWPAFPGTLADTLSVLTIVTGLVLFLGRVYSAPLRRLEPAWAFLKPLIVLLPFATGVIAMPPAWCPIDYYVMRVAHLTTAVIVMALLPYARLLSLQIPLTQILPEAAWLPSADDSNAAPAAIRPATE
jgi:hypothetical protein